MLRSIGRQDLNLPTGAAMALPMAAAPILATQVSQRGACWLRLPSEPTESRTIFCRFAAMISTEALSRTQHSAFAALR
jgi:hypothetical protein